MVIIFISTYFILIGYTAYGFPGNGANFCPSAVTKNYSVEFNITVDQKNESIIHFPVSTSKYPFRISATSKLAQPDYPVFIVVRQQREVTSWEIPLLVESKTETLTFFNTSRTLCHNDMELIAHQKYIAGDHKYNKPLSVSVSTYSITPVTVTIFVEDQMDFYIELDKNYTASISPSAPKYFYYRYSEKDDDFEGTVILDVVSLDVTCLIVSIQNYECPVFDLNEDIKYDGEYETINTRGGIIIKKQKFPNGFFVIFVAEPDNNDCDGDSLIPNNIPKEIIPLNRTSTITFTIKENITPQEYAAAIFLTLAVITCLCFILILLTCVFHLYETKYWRFSQKQQCELMANLSNSNNTTVDNGIAPTSSNADGGIAGNNTKLIEEMPSTSKIYFDPDASVASNNSEFTEDALSTSTVDVDNKSDTNNKDTEVLLPKEDNNTQANPYEYIDYLLKKSRLKLSDLATKNSETSNFFLHVITVGIFYGTPVVQLVITHQRIMNATGNLDMCYYNFLCAHPLISINDFNHVFSNLGYLVAGTLFIVITACRDNALGRRCNLIGRCNVLCRGNILQLTHIDNFGIPKHYGLYYAMGTAVIMEGVLSGCYHICPSQENFQFDTSFMYVIAVLGVVKLYQKRHPDINATAHVVFLLLSIATLITAVGIFENHIAVWAIFIIFYSIVCVIVVLKMYFVNNVCRGFELFWDDMDTTSINSFLHSLKPVKIARFTFLFIALFANLLLAFMGFYFQKYDTMDFGTFLLYILLMNTFGYTTAYIIFKCIYCEPCTLQYILYILLTLISWSVATVCYFKHSTEWTLTAAESRQKNTHCILQNFYDYHDIWHLLSATALFFSCMLLLTVDDKLIYTPHSDIDIF